jgi:polar amino acid transport system substrate-binding protein
VTALNTALNGVIQGGEYDQVLNRWGEGVERISHSEINPLGLGDTPL